MRVFIAKIKTNKKMSKCFHIFKVHNMNLDSGSSRAEGCYIIDIIDKRILFWIYVMDKTITGPLAHSEVSLVKLEQCDVDSFLI